MDRRRFTAASVLVLGAGTAWRPAAAATPTPTGTEAQARFNAELSRLEAACRGRLGVGLHDLGSGLRLGYRGAERFPLCSTFKLLAAALVLHRVDRGQERLDRRIRFSKADLVRHSPLTGPAAGGPGLTLAQLCHATVTQSDNTAGNLILASFGGPAGLTAYARTLGDAATRLDRNETALNEATPGDPRDTTTPEAMLGNLHALLVGDALSSSSRAQLRDWLLANRTGDTRLRALLPPGWRVGDKTGTGDHGTNNDVGLLLPPSRPPLLLTAYLTACPAPSEERDAVLAQVGKLAASLVAG